MFDHIRGTKNYFAIAFFVSLLIIGQFILLNLSLAILLQNFELIDEKMKKKKEKNKYNFKPKLEINKTAINV